MKVFGMNKVPSCPFSCFKEIDERIFYLGHFCDFNERIFVIDRK